MLQSCAAKGTLLISLLASANLVELARQPPLPVWAKRPITFSTCLTFSVTFWPPALLLRSSAAPPPGGAAAGAAGVRPGPRGPARRAAAGGAGRGVVPVTVAQYITFLVRHCPFIGQVLGKPFLVFGQLQVRDGSDSGSPAPAATLELWDEITLARFLVVL